MDNVYAPQSEIDTACENLLQAMSNLEGHEFIKPQPTIKVGGETIVNGGNYVINENSQITVTYEMNEGAMIKSAEWMTKNENGAESAISGNNLIITKTNEADSASITVELITLDNYDRTDVFSYTINVVKSADVQTINIKSITLTADGEAIGSTLTKTGYATNYSDFSGIQLGYVAEPSDAAAPVSVAWTSGTPSFVNIDQNGFITLTDLGKRSRLNTSRITCTVTNADGTTASAQVLVTVSRS
jgi:hypothetical protein